MKDWATLTKELRLKLGLKQAAFADYLGTTQPTVCRWERGVQIPEERFQRKIQYQLLSDSRVLPDTLVAAMIRCSPGLMSVVDRDLQYVCYSAGLKAALGPKVQRLEQYKLSTIATPVVKSVVAGYLPKLFSQGSDLISVSVNDRGALVSDLYVRRCWSAIYVWGERYVVCQDYPISPETAQFIDLKIVTADEVAELRF